MRRWFVASAFLAIVGLACLAHGQPMTTGAGKKPGGGAAGPTWYLATCNGTSGKIQSASSLSGSSTPTSFLFAANIQYGSNTNGRSLFGSNLAQTFDFRMVGSNATLRVNYGAGNEITFDAALSIQQNADNIIIIRVDTTQATIGAGVQAYNNGSAWSPAGGTWTQNFSAQMSAETPWTVCTGPNSFYGGRIKWLYFDYGGHAGTYPDFSVAGNRALFNEGTLLADGSNVAGAAPYVFFGGAAVTNWTSGTNNGTGGGTWTYTATISKNATPTRFAGGVH